MYIYLLCVYKIQATFLYFQFLLLKLVKLMGYIGTKDRNRERIMDKNNLEGISWNMSILIYEYELFTIWTNYKRSILLVLYVSNTYHVSLTLYRICTQVGNIFFLSISISYISMQFLILFYYRFMSVGLATIIVCSLSLSS